jgi:hypothetical protein
MLGASLACALPSQLEPSQENPNQSPTSDILIQYHPVLSNWLLELCIILHQSIYIYIHIMYIYICVYVTYMYIYIIHIVYVYIYIILYIKLFYIFIIYIFIYLYLFIYLFTYLYRHIMIYYNLTLSSNIPGFPRKRWPNPWCACAGAGHRWAS